MSDKINDKGTFEETLAEEEKSSDVGTINVLLSLTSSPSTARFPLKVLQSDTPSSLRRSVSKATRIPLTLLKLIFRGRIIQDKEEGCAITEYLLEDGSVVHCTGKPQPIFHPTTTTTGSYMTMTPDVTRGGGVSDRSALPNTNTSPLTSALLTLQSENDQATYRTAVETLAKIIDNVKSHPMENKYRKLKKENASFESRLGRVIGGDAAMKAVGFTLQTDDSNVVQYVMETSADAWPKLLADKSQVDMTVAQCRRTTMTTPLTTFGSMLGTPSGDDTAGNPTTPPPFPGIGGVTRGTTNLGELPGMLDIGSIPPEMEAMVQSMFSNPQAMQNLMQNPMVTQMIENDPRVSNNPLFRQSLNELTSNPQMLQQVGQLMSDPAVRQQVLATLSHRGGGIPDMGSGMTSTMSGSNSTNSQGSATFDTIYPQAFPRQTEMQPQQSANNLNTNSSNNDANTNDNEQSEEEMIAEAIARSLRDQ